MRKIFAATALVMASFFWNCEKDDICDENTPTTPNLVIEFFDITNPTVLKNVTNLQITATGSTDTLDFNAVSKVLLPLNISADSTTYKFVLNSTNTAIDNQDNLQFSYSVEEIFVSRACGYKTIFTLDATTPLLHTDAAMPDGLWIQDITISEPIITSETETHVKIYF
jgi:hypothetical protein